MNGIKQGIEADYGNKHGIYGVAHNLFIAIYDELPEPKMKSKKGIMNEKRID